MKRNFYMHLNTWSCTSAFWNCWRFLTWSLVGGSKPLGRHGYSWMMITETMSWNKPCFLFFIGYFFVYISNVPCCLYINYLRYYITTTCNYIYYKTWRNKYTTQMAIVLLMPYKEKKMEECCCITYLILALPWSIRLSK